MNTSGIIRKIDELGRIVLPKELRRHLNINPGDDFQILLSEDKIILEKYSYLKSNEKDIVKVINGFIETSNDKILLIINNEIVNRNNDKILPEIIQIINKREIYRNNEIKNYKITNSVIENGRILIYPLVLNSDLYGALIIVSIDNIEKALEIAKTLDNIIRQFYK